MKYRRFAASCWLVLLLTGFALEPAAAAEDAGDFLVSFGRRAAEELRDEKLSAEQREQRFRELLNEAVDVPAISKFILGVHWRRATARERSDFLRVFEDIVMQRFLPIFTRSSDEYAGSSFSIEKVRRSKNNRQTLFVSAKLLREQGQPVRLVWRVRERDNKYKILDISAEGLSMVITLRQEYNAAIKTAGSLGGLVELLRAKVRKGSYAPKAKTATTD